MKLNPLRIYEMLLVNDYINTEYPKPSRLGSIGFIYIIQFLQLNMIFAPFGYFGVPGSKYSKCIIVLVTLILVTSNLLYFNNKKFELLLSNYTILSTGKKKQIDTISTIIVVITFIGNVSLLAYFIFSHNKI